MSTITAPSTSIHHKGFSKRGGVWKPTRWGPPSTPSDDWRPLTFRPIQPSPPSPPAYDDTGSTYSEGECEWCQCEWCPSPSPSPPSPLPVAPASPSPPTQPTPSTKASRGQRFKGRNVTIFAIGEDVFTPPKTFPSMNSCMRDLVDRRFNIDYNKNTLKSFKTWAEKNRVSYDLGPTFGGAFMP